MGNYATLPPSALNTEVEMMHALAIGCAGPDAAAAVDGLWAAGYRSIIRVEDAGDAPDVLACFRPDLILVLPDAAARDAMTALRGIARKANAPVVVARAGVERALDCLGPAATSEGMPPRSVVRRTREVQLAA